MTTPPEFTPTPEQVEEVAIRLYGLAQNFEMWEARGSFPTLFPSSQDTYMRHARWHLTELHRETETLRSQVEALKFTIKETLGGTVEGLPTHECNWLQRARELVRNEKMLQRIAYLAYHHLSSNCSHPESAELGRLLTYFKKDCDLNFPEGIENPWPEALT